MPRLTELGPLETGDNVLDVTWSPDGATLAVTPSTGETVLVSEEGKILRRLPEHAMGNGRPAWFQGLLATCGFDGKIRLDGGSPLPTGRGMIERLRTSPDGRHLAAAQGKNLLIFDSDGKATGALPTMPVAIADFAWNPSRPNEIAIVGAGGARMWRLGETEPFSRFDWGGASLKVEWSADGRWLVTGDQTASVHLFDFTRDYPLHIQGFETKVRALAFSPDGKRLATGGSPVITVWPCTGETGPEGVEPLQLEGHDADPVAADFSGNLLATGDETGALLILTFEGDRVVRKRVRRDAGISALAWHPSRPALAVGHADGTASVLELRD